MGWECNKAEFSLHKEEISGLSPDKKNELNILGLLRRRKMSNNAIGNK